MSTGQPSSEERRVLIFGNSGSGKSTLAARLAAELGIEHLDLDVLAWQPTDPPQRVPLAEARRELSSFTEKFEQWVVEGCYADLLELLVPEATELIFIDLPVSLCQANALNRPWEPHKYPSKEAQDANLDMLLDWIAAYPQREGALGRPAHMKLFESFTGTKQRQTTQPSG